MATTVDYKDLIIEMSVKEKSELKTYVIDSKDFENKVEKIVKRKLKNNRELEDMVVDITKNVLTQLYKTLWVKRNFWATTLSNKST
jgi:hypothetical protein